MSRSFVMALILLSLIWGGSFFFVKVLLVDFGPLTVSFLRSAFGLAAIVAVMLVLRKPFQLGQIRWVPMAIMALINTSIPWSLIAFSETRITSSMASVLNATTPLWTLIIGILFFGAVSTRMQWLGMVVALAGLVILLDINPSSVVSVDLIGFAAMIVVTLFYALGSHLSRKMMKDGLTMYQIAFGTLLSATIASGIAALTFEPFNASRLASLENIGVLIGIGVFGSGIAYFLFYYMIQQGGAEYATMVTYLVPASAIVWGATLLDEPLEWSLLTGLVCILGGLFLAGRGKNGGRA